MVRVVLCWACGVVAVPPVYSHRRVSRATAVRSVRVRLRRTRYGLAPRPPQLADRKKWELVQHCRLRSDAQIDQSARRGVRHRRHGRLVPTREAPRRVGKQLLVCAQGCQGSTWPDLILLARRMTAAEGTLRAKIELGFVVAAAVVAEGLEGWWIRRGLLRWEMSCASWARMTPFAKVLITMRYNSNHADDRGGLCVVLSQCDACSSQSSSYCVA